MSAHTPGPWYYERTQRYFGVASRAPWYRSDQGRAGKNSVCRIVISVESEHFAEGEANARLIAAAPELLEAVRLLTADDLTGEQIHNRVAFGKAAIAKAVGP